MVKIQGDLHYIFDQRESEDNIHKHTSPESPGSVSPDLWKLSIISTFYHLICLLVTQIFWKNSVKNIWNYCVIWTKFEQEWSIEVQYHRLIRQKCLFKLIVIVTTWHQWVIDQYSTIDLKQKYIIMANSFLCYI